ncbi:cupin domain-containing protein [Zavarzinella formosa]|uniref:cupin domain-containing protein n=1 Tax=Zavarzinella formosa TaxID=360055 RepID=UPI000306F03B|nr:cupin domain-containing protein [Zavarzinella formosa]
MTANLFSHLPANLANEVIQTLVSNNNISIERIISLGHTSPDGFWYDQPRHEWVMVLQGEAKVRFEGDEHPVLMRPGDAVNIPAHRRHRVEWTTPDEPTIWLAVHYGD